MTLDALNSVDVATFVDVLGDIFENSPWVAAAVSAQRPFADVGALHAAMCTALRAAPLEAHVALIAAHPDLVGQAALSGTLSAASAAEQAAAGLDRLAHEDVEMFADLNAVYRTRFGFPFVISVRENKKMAILTGLQTRIHNDRATEIAVALDEVAKIARLRLLDTVSG